MGLFPFIHLFALGFLLTSQTPALPPPQEVAASLQKKYDGIRDFTADFVHESEGGLLRKKQTERGVVSMVLCLEDSIGDEDVAAGEENLVRQFADLAARTDLEPPLLFIRVRTPEQIPDLVRRLGAGAELMFHLG